MDCKSLLNNKNLTFMALNYIRPKGVFIFNFLHLINLETRATNYN